MEKSAIIHKSDSIYSFPLNKNSVEIRLLTKKGDNIKKVELVYNDKYKFHEFVNYKEIFKKYSDDRFDYYIEIVNLSDLRFAYIFKITTTLDEVYYFSESGITDSYDITKGFYDFFQVSYINEIDIVNKNEILKNRVFYQIFVDRFNKSLDNNNPRININWGEMVKQKTIAGGNLKGIVEKINYLKELGINGLYLTPIFESDSNHKYNIKDYFSIARDFGDENDLKDLIQVVKENDMLLILDGVFNHISKDNELFKDVMLNGNKSKYFKWFFINGENIDLINNNYERFADDLGMPRLNLNNEEVQRYVIDVGSHYVKKYGIDGFRLDVSDEIPHRFWIKFKEEMLKINKNFVLIGENWHNAHSYLNSGYEFDSIMNYCITKDILQFIAWDNYDSEHFKNRIISALMRYKSNVNYNMLNLLSSHDVHRFYTECKKDDDKFLLGYAFIFMHLGIPCIYYGDEIGMEGNYDPDSRRCFIWDEDKWNKKIYETIKKLISIHKNYCINELDYIISNEEDLICISRFNNDIEYNLYINNSGKDKELVLKNFMLSNLYKDNVLQNKGFVIFRKEKKYESK